MSPIATAKAQDEVHRRSGKQHARVRGEGPNSKILWVYDEEDWSRMYKTGLPLKSHRTPLNG